MPKDSPSDGLGHRHEWEGVIVWLNSATSTTAANIAAVCPSAHGVRLTITQYLNYHCRDSNHNLGVGLRNLLYAFRHKSPHQVRKYLAGQSSDVAHYHGWRDTTNCCLGKLIDYCPSGSYCC